MPPRVRRWIRADSILCQVRYRFTDSGLMLTRRRRTRCDAATCPVCTRTCTAVPPTREPTPALSWTSSTSPPTPMTPSPRRSALSLSTNANILHDALSDTSRRRKHEDDLSDRVVGKDMDAEGWTQGCGRVVCRACSTESIAR